jgi:hypothetical protein
MEGESADLLKPSLLKRFRGWLRRDVVEIRVLDQKRGLISEKDMEKITIVGVVFAEDAQESRKIQEVGPKSFALTIHPPFVSMLCPFQEKQTVQRLIRDESGEYLLLIKGVDPNE